MASSRGRILPLLLWMGLLRAAMRPGPALERWVGLATAPLRAFAELTSPLQLVRSSRVHAAQERLVAESLAADVDLVADLARDAEPKEPRLLAGRRLVHGEVVGRAAESRDRIRVRLEDARGVAVGMPVAAGNAYVGRIVRLEPGPGLEATALVELVTARGFHVGARASAEAGDASEPVLMTVGGIDLGTSRSWSPDLPVRLAVHAPSDRSLSVGFVRVHELFGEIEPYAPLAEGLHLGRVVASEGRGRWALEPELDYLDGLFQVVVLCPADPDLPSGVLPESALTDPHWVRVTPLGLADPSPWREAVKVRGGTRDGIRAGAAVTAIGSRLVGRVTRAGLWSSDVSFLGDPGFTVLAVARIEGDDVPQVLGRLVSLGRDGADGSVRMRWVARVRIDAAGAASGNGGSVRARLYTGSGDEGVPSGSFLGEASLPLSAEPGEAPVVRLAATPEPRDLRQLFVRTEAAP